MVNVLPGWQQSDAGMTAQDSQDCHVGQDATTRTIACSVCKALYTPAPAHQQLVLAPHIVLESAFMSMCHFCFRCRRAACPDCWDAVHGVCGVCVAEAELPFRTQVKPLSNVMPPLLQQQQVAETMHAAPVLVCIQHGKFYVEPGKDDGRPQGATHPPYPSPVPQHEKFYVKPGRDDGRPRGATPHNHPSPVPTMSALPPHDRHGRDGGSADGRGGPSRASVVPPSKGDRNSGGPSRASVLPLNGNKRTSLYGRPSYSKYAEERDKDKESKKKAGQPIGWRAETMGAIEQWLTGALLVLLLTIVTMIVLAEASPSANAQIMHVFQVDIRSEVAYLIHLIGQLQW